MKLFLTSSGLSDENESEFLELLGKNPRGLKVAFIPTAMNQESQEVKDKYIPVDVADLEKFGMEVTFIDLENFTEDNIVEALKSFDVIYVYGGNTFYLMHYANTSGFKKHIQEIIKDKVYVGVSAGSVIAGPDVSLSQWGKDSDRNSIGLKNMTGLELVSFGIIPHWGGQSYKGAEGYQYEVKYIRDGEVIVINK